MEKYEHFKNDGTDHFFVSGAKFPLIWTTML